MSGYQPTPRFLTKQEYVRTRGMFRIHAHGTLTMNTYPEYTS